MVRFIMPQATSEGMGMKVVVIGGGIIGCLTACFLKQRGVDVIVLERGKTGQEASLAGAGILCPIHPWFYPDSFSHLINASLAMYTEFRAQLEADTGMSIEWQKSGLLIPFFDDDTSNHWQKAVDWSARFGWHIEQLDTMQTLQLEPTLSPQLRRSLRWPEVAQLRNPRLLQAVRCWMQQLDVELHEHCEVTSLLSNQGTVSGVQCADGQGFESDQVLLASGSWSGELAAQLGFDLPIKPVKGQIVLLKGKSGLMKSIIKHDDAYFVPRADGRVLIGASMEFVGFERGNTEQITNQLMASMLKIAPGLKTATVERQWMGFRPGSPDGLPYLGEVSSMRGLWVASGHYRNGVALAPITAKVMTAKILGEPVDVDCSDFSVGRLTSESSTLGFPPR
ncbi:MAG: glycine oxidase ThiO [Mariprofundaceae bacterium]|nr:glycine oxidase ThiO [Mariprofundaceae bacterium]